MQGHSRCMVIVKSSDKPGSLEKEMANLSSILAFRTP